MDSEIRIVNDNNTKTIAIIILVFLSFLVLCSIFLLILYFSGINIPGDPRRPPGPDEPNKNCNKNNCDQAIKTFINQNKCFGPNVVDNPKPTECNNCPETGFRWTNQNNFQVYSNGTWKDCTTNKAECLRMLNIN